MNQTASTVYDSHNNLIQSTDTQGVTSLFRYDSFNNVISTTVGITTTSLIRATTLYTYSYDFPYPGDSRLREVRKPEGIVTHYAYDARGQGTGTTVGYGTPQAQTTTYAYDSLGRVISTTVGVGTALQRTDNTSYNADNTIAQTIRNYHDGVFDPARPDEDITTTYGYDGLGRPAWVRDVLSHYDATHYNNAGQIDWITRNLSPAQFDSQGQPIFREYTPTQPDANVSMLYGYDGLRRTVLVTETGILTGTFDPGTLRFSTTTTRVTRTEYDILSRPITITLNYRPDLPTGTLPDVNVQTVTTYDEAGNVVEQRDMLGRRTKIEYDVLNRPIKKTINFEDGLPLTGARDTDLISVTEYDRMGRVAREIENYVDGVFTATEPITDRVTLYEYDTLGRVITTTLSYDLATRGSRTDTNRTTVIAYDPLTNRMSGVRDELGRWTVPQRDELGRVTTTISNCRDGSGNPISQGCAPFASGTPDRNVSAQRRYDLTGGATEQIDALSHITRTTYDVLGRPRVTTQNYVSGGPVTPDTNVTTRRAYDALGRTTIITDALLPVGAMTRYAYDGLGRTTILTDTVGRVTRMGYDGTGTQRWVRRPDGRLAVSQVDGLGRVTATIESYQNGVVGANEGVDQDLITRTVYDIAGRVIQTVDTASRVTGLAYDKLNHLISVTENVQTTCATSPCNVQTKYIYDRAGNRVAITDARGNTERFTYNVANQQITATDALGRATAWEYDALNSVRLFRRSVVE